MDELYPRIQSRVSQMDSARPALRSALNSVAQQPDLSQDAHADQPYIEQPSEGASW